VNRIPLLRTSERDHYGRFADGHASLHSVSGADNPNWTGNDASYFARHWRVRSVRGRASDYECEACAKRPGKDWAQTHGTNGLNPEHYRALCRSCHASYDGAGERLQGCDHRGERHGLHKLTESDVYEIRRRLANGEVQRIIANDYGIHQVTISSIKLRKTWGWLPEGGDEHGDD
jgi:hypothetical protein